MVLILLLGVPGSGKGFLSQELVRRLGFKHFSTGKIFRSLKDEKATKELGKGKLVSDDYVNTLAIDGLKNLENLDKDAKVILDGYPRTLVQAEFMGKHYKIDKVFYLAHKDEDFIVKRLSNRVLCRAEDHSFNLVSNPPKVPGVCDFDGSELYRRSDDVEDVIRARLETYKKSTQPLIDYYKKLGILEELDISKSVDELISRFAEFVK